VELEKVSLSAYSHYRLTEIPSVEHSDKGFGRSLETVDDIFPITDPSISD
jgi:hypothetical protein